MSCYSLHIPGKSRCFVKFFRDPSLSWQLLRVHTCAATILVNKGLHNSDKSGSVCSICSFTIFRIQKLIVISWQTAPITQFGNLLTRFRRSSDEMIHETDCVIWQGFLKLSEFGFEMWKFMMMLLWGCYHFNG